MGNKVCLDTDILIDFLRNKKEIVNWIKDNEENCLFATTTINLFELYYGACISANSDKINLVKQLQESLIILDLSNESAEKAGKEVARLRDIGKEIEFKDILIGIIALENHFKIKTNNKKHFQRIEGLELT